MPIQSGSSFKIASAHLPTMTQFPFLAADLMTSASASKILSFGGSYSSVSYTHLDVYKRQRLDGVREGTVVAALLVGFIARTIGRYLSFMPEKLFGVVNETEEASGAVDNEAVTTGHFCIAIGRQYRCV